MNEHDFKWLREEYKKRKRSDPKYKTMNFEQFVDGFVSEIIGKVKKRTPYITITRMQNQ